MQPSSLVPVPADLHLPAEFLLLYKRKLWSKANNRICTVRKVKEDIWIPAVLLHIYIYIHIYIWPRPILKPAIEQRTPEIPRFELHFLYFQLSLTEILMEVVGARSSNASGAKYECLLFDMDDTLYPLSAGLNLACRKNIEEFMLHHLGIEGTEVPKMCLDLYKECGTTMAGLKDLGYEFDNDEFHAYVHGRLPYDALKPDPILRNLLLSMPQRKIIFTNADKAHAAQVLSRLGLEDCFEGVICFETLNPPPPEAPSADHANGAPDDDNDSAGESSETTISGDAINDETKSKTIFNTAKQQILCKPSLTSMLAAIRIANVDPNKTIFFDDSARNIASAKLAGLHTVIVGSSNLVPGADHALSSIHNIKEALPQIWEAEEEHLDQIIQSRVETVVLA